MVRDEAVCLRDVEFVEEERLRWFVTDDVPVPLTVPVTDQIEGFMCDQDDLAALTCIEKLAFNLANDPTRMRGRVPHRHTNVRCLVCEVQVCLPVQLVRGLN